MSKLNLWFLDVGHGDCCYIELPNGARLMIDCGGGSDNWPSKLLSHYSITKTLSPVPLAASSMKHGLDNLIITHPHGDHLSDIAAIHDDIGFHLLSGNYRSFIDKIADTSIDYKKRGQEAAKKFKEVVRSYCGTYNPTNDRVALAKSDSCHVKKARFVEYEDGIDLNETSYLVTISYAGQKILFAGDLTASAVTKILQSNKAEQFKSFVKGTTILKIPHHGRENGCSPEMFDLFGSKPILCVASDEVLNDRNQGTSSIDWYTARTNDKKVKINDAMESRKVLTTRKDKDIHFEIPLFGDMAVRTNVFKDLRGQLL